MLACLPEGCDHSVDVKLLKDIGAPTSQDLANYELYSVSGRGRWATVIRAKHKFTGLRVAVKCVQKHHNGVIRRFMMREKEAIKRVKDHPGVAELYEVFEDEKYVFLVQEYIEGGSLREKLAADGRMSEEQLRPIIYQLAQVLIHCHARGVVHRDLSISNIMFDGHGTLKLVDFGLAAIVQDASTALLNETCGSNFYTPPEVYQASYGGKYVGPPVDAWAVGAVLHMALTNQLPFNGSMSQVKAGVGYKPPQKASSECQDLLRGLLCTVAADRLSLAQVLQHPWLAPHTKSIVEALPPYCPPSAEDTETVLELLAGMGLNRSDVLGCLATDVYNHTSAAFYMLRQATCQQRTEALLRGAGRLVDDRLLFTKPLPVLLRPLATSI
eukprot:comp6228_c0_seq1/m.2052 comp6228_c0_seq1/g.2052  ORF comp6228_c0_seq1/g.2052 comp6228_c0_seq1/m.2052 type:complete len:384 (-) comp6228_c0_seq1:85-1236(-)